MSQTKASTSIQLLRQIINSLDDSKRRTIPEVNVDSVGLGMENEKLWLEQKLKEIESDLFKIVVVGKFNAGKSSFINALIGEEILPSGAIPTTGLINHIKSGKEYLLEAIHFDETSQILELENFRNNFRLYPKLSNPNAETKEVDLSKIKHLNVFIPNEVISAGIQIIDTPGIGEHSQRTRLVLDVLPNADCILVVMDATQNLSKLERDFFQILGQRPFANVFFIINKFDLLKKDKSIVKNFVKKGLTKYFTNRDGDFLNDLYDSRVFFVSSQQALISKTKKNASKETYTESNIAPLETQLLDFLKIDQRQELKLKSIVSELSFLQYKAKEKVKYKEILLTEPLEVLQEKYETSTTRFQELRKSSHRINFLFVDIGEEIKFKVFGSLIDYIDKMDIEWEEDAKQIDLSDITTLEVISHNYSQKSKERLAKKLTNKLEIYIESKLIQWAQSLSKIIPPILEELSKDLKKDLEKFQLDLDLIESSFQKGELRKDTHTNSTKIETNLELITRIVRERSFIDGIIGGIKLNLFDHINFLWSNPNELGSQNLNIISILLDSISFTTANPLSRMALKIGSKYFYDLHEEDVRDLSKQADEQTKEKGYKIREVLRHSLIKGISETLFSKLKNQVQSKREIIQGSIKQDFVKAGNLLERDLNKYLENAKDEQKKIIQQKELSQIRLEKYFQSLHQNLLHLNQSVEEYCELNLGRVLNFENVENLGKAKSEYLIQFQEIIKKGDISDEIEDSDISFEESSIILPNSNFEVDGLNQVVLKKIQSTLRKKMGLSEEAEYIAMGEDAEIPSVKLARMIGLSSVKEAIVELKYYQEELVKRKELNKNVSNNTSLHLAFLGNPGTGKTSVANIVGEIYKKIGLLKKGHVVPVTRKDLIAGYIGQTAIKTQDKIDEAKGGILFIDEAYDLVIKESPKDFGHEAISRILEAMETSNEFAVIVAGYPNEMEEFFNYNPGLLSRFPEQNRIHFPNYSKEELFQILQLELNARDFLLSEESAKAIKEVISGLIIEEGDKKTFGNARLMRSLAQYLERRRAVRIRKSGGNSDDDVIQIEDIGMYEKYRSSVLKKSNETNVKTILEEEESNPSQLSSKLSKSNLSDKFSFSNQSKPQSQSTYQNHHGIGDIVGGNKTIIYNSDKEELSKYITLIPVPIGKQFVGQEEVLKELQSKLAHHSIVLLQGIGGLGKTSTTFQFIEIEEKQYSHIAWLSCTDNISKAFLENSELLANLKVTFDESSDEIARFNLVLSKLSTIEAKTLIVIDNVGMQHEGELKKLSLPANFKIILTSREIIKSLPIVKLDVLDFQSASKLFHQNLNRTDIEIKENELQALFEKLGYHTLLIELIGRSFSYNKQWSSIDVLLLYLENNGITNSINVPDNRQILQMVSELFNVSELSIEEQQILRYFSLLPKMNIRYDEMQFLFKMETQPLNLALSSLISKGFLQKDDREGYNCHQIIQENSKNKLRPNVNNCAPLITSLGRELGEKYNFDSLRDMAIIAPRYLPILKSIVDFFSEETILFANIFQNIAIFSTILGEFPQAIKWHNRDIEIKKSEKNADPNLFIGALKHYTDTLVSVGKYEQAKKILLEELECITQYLPESKKELGTIYERKGLLNLSLGELAEAIESLEKAREIYEGISVEIEPYHQAITNNNIGLALLRLERLDEALQRFNAAKSFFDSSDEDFNSYGHGSTYLYMSIIYLATDGLDKARHSIDKAKSIFLKDLPKDDFVFAGVFNVSALIYFTTVENSQNASNRDSFDEEILNKAIEEQKHAMEILSIFRPDNHHDCVPYYMVMSMMYQLKKEKELAKKWHAKSLAILEKKDGKNFQKADFYFKTITVFSELYQDNELIVFLRKAIEALPEKEEYKSNRAYYYLCWAEYEKEKGNYLDSLNHNLKSYSLYKENIPNDNLIHAYCLQQIALSYQGLRDFDKAVTMQKEVIKLCEALMEETDPELAIVYANFALLNFDKKKYQIALEFKQKAVRLDSNIELTYDMKHIGQLALIQISKNKFAHVIVSANNQSGYSEKEKNKPVQFQKIKEHDTLIQATLENETLTKIYGKSRKIFLNN